MLSAIHKSKAGRVFSFLAAKNLSTIHSFKNAPIDIHPEIEEAIASRSPIVALETAIYTHGMPFPTNVETFESLEKIVRKAGSVPATIGIIDGRVKIGLTLSQLERLADAERKPTVVKVSRRDIGPTLALKKDGGTTCSATLIFAALVGIKVSNDQKHFEHNPRIQHKTFILPLGFCHRRV
jgi:pseudouridine-5'-phosphate glycosidase